MDSATPAVRRLSAAQRQAYERDGYVVVPEVFPPAELALIDAEIDRLIAQPGVAAGPHRQGWIYDLRRSELTGRFAEDERLLALIEELVVPGIAIHSSKLVTKTPYTQDICHWHQDEAFYQDRADDSGVASQVRMSVWVPLQDAHQRNGCLWVVPGSHRWGLADYTWQENGTCQKRIERWGYADQRAVALPVRAGSVVLFSAWTWHHSKNNHTADVRRAFIVSYQEATLPGGEGEQWKILRPAR